MIQINWKTGLIFFFVFFATEAFSQEFFEDGSMKLTEISVDKKYGYEPDYENSIKVGNTENITKYLNSLKGPKGEKTFAARIGSCCMYERTEGNGLLAKWQITYEGLQEPVILYLNKNVYENPKCPMGFTFKTAKDISPVIKFPPDSIVKVIPCSPTMYAVGDLNLKDKLGVELPLPDKNPGFKDSLAELRKYFAANPLTGEGIKNMGFRTHISFLVTCDGKAGNYTIISNGKGDLETYANQVLAVVNKMPQSWLAATKDGKAVDCYQVLSFTVTGGQLDKVSYRESTKKE